MLKKNSKNADKILINVYGSSFVYSMIAITVVACLEVFMLAYTVVNAAFFREYLWKYRSFYIILLSAALLYIIISVVARRQAEKRYRWLNVVNPAYTLLFFAWALGIIYQDLSATGVLDLTVFMTFSLVIPLGFYVLPLVYGVIAAVTDLVMLYLVHLSGGGVGPMINTGIFIIFQLVLGVSFLLMKTRLAERIVMEQENADVDVLTGCGNRRAYEKEMEGYREREKLGKLTCLEVDINGLKEVNDNIGHDAGDTLITGAARCIEDCFGEKGKVFRTGGDEFVVLTEEEDPERLYPAFDKRVQSWSEVSGLSLSVSYGAASSADHPGADASELAKLADARMLEAKTRYYQQTGRERRKRS